ncbi:MAG: hypothetical protein R2716_11585 [Microthrixaceae bacterium]
MGRGAPRHADIGNPHLVLEVPDASSVDVASEGPALEADYPLGINVHFVTLQPGDGIELRVWERGAGVTRACGSGAVAAVVAADRWGAVDAASSPIEVHMPGGSATVQLREGEALLTGRPPTWPTWSSNFRPATRTGVTRERSSERREFATGSRGGDPPRRLRRVRR